MNQLGSNLVFDFVYVPGDGGEKLLPTDAKRLHRVRSVTIVEDHSFLNFLEQELEDRDKV